MRASTREKIVYTWRELKPFILLVGVTALMLVGTIWICK